MRTKHVDSSESKQPQGQIKLSQLMLLIAVFWCGAAVMILELMGSRVLAPHFGSTIYVWTSLIGIIMGALSLGYFIGGRIADKRANQGTLGLIILGGAVYILAATILGGSFLHLVKLLRLDVRVSAAIATLFLFAPPSVLLGMVSPYATRLRIQAVATSGMTVGNIYALSTMGSIVGTFLSGYILIALIGTFRVLLLLSLSLMTVGPLLVIGHSNKKILSGWCLLNIAVAIIILNVNIAPKGIVIADLDTRYSRVLVLDRKNESTSRTIRYLKTDGIIQSSMYLDSDELVAKNYKFFVLSEYFSPHAKKALMIGGGGFSYPKEFLQKYPKAEMDVVEIDPQIVDIARKYFRLPTNPRLNIIIEDGRTYLDRTNEKYDVIFLNAFQTLSPPFQLTTIEAMQSAYNALLPNGVAIVHIVSALEGKKGSFFHAQYSTLKAIFSDVYPFPVSSTTYTKDPQSIFLIATKGGDSFKGLPNVPPHLQVYTKKWWQGPIDETIPILRDDFAPVEYYVARQL